MKNRISNFNLIYSTKVNWQKRFWYRKKCAKHTRVRTNERTNILLDNPFNLSTNSQLFTIKFAWIYGLLWPETLLFKCFISWWWWLKVNNKSAFVCLRSAFVNNFQSWWSSKTISQFFCFVFNFRLAFLSRVFFLLCRIIRLIEHSTKLKLLLWNKKQKLQRMFHIKCQIGKRFV